MSEAVLIKSRKKSGESITKTDIQKFEKKYGKIENFSSVIFLHGMAKKFTKKILLYKKSWLVGFSCKISCIKK